MRCSCRRRVPVIVPAMLAVILLLFSAACTTREIPGQTMPPAGNLTPAPVPAIANVRFVDAVGNNFLFRGAHPVTERNGSFGFDDDALQAALRNASHEAGRELPGNFTVVDISLLWADNAADNFRERSIIRAEEAYFAMHPEAGQLRLWPSYGTALSPADPSLAAHRDYLADHLGEWLGDPLIDRVATVRQYLTDPAAMGLQPPVMVYVHCFGGCDRTGELIGAYSLRYRNLTWEEARDANGRQCRPDRAYDPANCNALQRYGLWLNRTQGRPVNWTADPACYRPPS